MSAEGLWKLAPEPEEARHHAEWLAWAQQAQERGSWEVLREAPADPARLGRWRTALKAILAQAMGKGSLNEEDLTGAALDLLEAGAGAPAHVVRAAELLARQALQASGPTRTDYLLLLAFFVWPGRELVPGLSEEAWEALVQRPWPTDAGLLKSMVEALALRPLPDDARRLWVLADKRIQVGNVAQGRAVLEAIVLAHCKVVSMEQVDAASLRKKPVLDGVPITLRSLASLYRQQRVRTRHAHAVITAAGETLGGGHQAAEAGEEYEVPFADTYLWAEGVVRKIPREGRLDLEPLQGARGAVVRAREQGLKDLARERAEALLAARLRGALDLRLSVNEALAAFVKLPKGEVAKDPVLRLVGADLALHYCLSDVVQEPVTAFVTRVADSPMIAGANAPLEKARDALISWANANDPLYYLRRDVAARPGGLDDAQQATLTKVLAALAGPAGAARVQASAALAFVGRSAADAAGSKEGDPRLEAACRTALKVVLQTYLRPAADLDGLLAEGARLRASEAQFERLRQRLWEVAGLGAPDGALKALGALAAMALPGPKGMAVELGTAIVACSWAVARIGALLGHDLRDPARFGFFVDALTAAVSWDQGEGLLAHESSLRQEHGLRGLPDLDVWNIPGGGPKLAGYLWTPASAGAQRADRVAENAARLLNFSLLRTHQAVVHKDPIRVLLKVGESFDLGQRVVRAALAIGLKEHLLQRAAARA